MSDDPGDTIIQRQLDTDVDNPGVEIASAVAEIEETKMTDLATMYECVDGVLDNLFSNPPSPEAQMEITFSYHTYRITVDQDGTAEFVKTQSV